MHVGDHRLLIGAPATADVGRGQTMGIQQLRIEPYLVGGIGQHLAMGDQKADGLAWPALQGSRRIEALQGGPDAVAALERQVVLRPQIDRVGDEAAAGAGELHGPVRWGDVGDREEAAGGDVIHQEAAETAGGIDQTSRTLLLAGVQQDPHGFNRGGAEHHQRRRDPLPFA